MIRLLGFLLLVAGGIFTWLGVEDGIATWRRVALAEDVIAELARFDPAPDGKTVVPVATFLDVEGKSHDVRLPAVSRPNAAIGSPVHVLHPPGRPDLAETGDLIAIWTPAAVPVGGGLIGIVLGLGLMTSRRRRPEEMPRLPFLLRFGLFAVAFGLIAVAWTEYAAVVDTLHRFPRARGTVVAVDQGGAATIRFTTGDGVVVDYVDRSQPPGSLRPGEALVLGYSKSDPSGARIESFAEVWSMPAAWGIGAGLALLAALYAASIRRGKAARPKAPLPTPEPEPEAPAEVEPAGAPSLGAGSPLRAEASLRAEPPRRPEPPFTPQALIVPPKAPPRRGERQEPPPLSLGGGASDEG